MELKLLTLSWQLQYSFFFFFFFLNCFMSATTYIRVLNLVEIQLINSFNNKKASLIKMLLLAIITINN